ncbi:MAG: DUF819 domain-containing protein [Pyrinomonadaceae bacterium]
MEFTREPIYIIAVLLALIVVSEWLARKPFFSHIGSVLIVIIAAAIIANIGVIPSSQNAPPIYDGIFQYAAPLGIFFLLLEAKLKNLKFAGLPMIVMFLVGAAATATGAVVGYKILSPQAQVPLANAVAGMYTGTYTGGSANLNAVALAYGVNKDGVLYAAINAVDNILTTIWIILTLVLPKVLQKYFPRKKSIPPRADAAQDQLSNGNEFGLMDIAILLTLGFASLFISFRVAEYLVWMPSIVVLTTIALIFAQIPFVQRLRGGRTLGYLLIMLFLAVIGAYCDFKALIEAGDVAGVLLIWVTIIVFMHGAIIFTVGGIFKQDWDIVSIASNANVGGATSAPVCAASLGRPDLQLPGLLAGTLGTAIGTYLGITVAEILK